MCERTCTRVGRVSGAVMNSSPAMIVPPAPKAHASDLPTWQLLLQFTRKQHLEARIAEFERAFALNPN